MMRGGALLTPPENIFIFLHIFLASQKNNRILHFANSLHVLSLEESEGRRWRTRQKIEHLIPPSPISYPGDFFHKKIGKIDALASGGRDFLHGVWRNLRHGRHHPRRGIFSRDSAAAGHSDSLEFAHSIYDRRAFKCAALRRRLLRMGAPRDGKFLGISGSVAVAGREHF